MYILFYLSTFFLPVIVIHFYDLDPGHHATHLFVCLPFLQLERYFYLYSTREMSPWNKN